MTTVAVVLAAGKGTRMRSRMAKVAHRVAGRPMIAHVHAAIAALPDTVPLYVLGQHAEAVRTLLPEDVAVVLQVDQRGTGHAVRVAAGALPASCSEILVVYGDMPLLSTQTLEELRMRHHRTGALLSLLSADLANPFGYGRIVRDEQGVPVAVVEEKELQDHQRLISEVNTGVYVIDAAWLTNALTRLPEHGDGEYYLTDLVGFAAAEARLQVLDGASAEEVLGVNDRRQLAQAEHVMRMRVNQHLMDVGVTIIDPAATYVAADASIGMDTIIEPNTWIGEGVTIGEGCYIGANTRIIASALGHNCVITASVIEYSQIDNNVSIGPYAHLRVGSIIDHDAHVGNFAEIKNSSVGSGSKVPHFSYVGDAEIGAGVNFAAGAITANYDGTHKHRTVVGDNAFIGSGTILRAPVQVGAGAYTGAGCVVTHDVAEGELVVGAPARPVQRRRHDDSAVSR